MSRIVAELELSPRRGISDLKTLAHAIRVASAEPDLSRTVLGSVDLGEEADMSRIVAELELSPRRGISDLKTLAYAIRVASAETEMWRVRAGSKIVNGGSGLELTRLDSLTEWNRREGSDRT
jgi:hypothetical protein